MSSSSSSSSSTISSSSISSSSSSSSISRVAWLYMCLLALQFGFQPMLTKHFTPPSVCRSSIVIIQEIIKFTFALIFLLLSGQIIVAWKEFTFYSWLQVAVFPAGLYCIQNIAALYAYQNLDPLTFNVLNQTKTLSAAFCCYLIIGYKQSFIQIIALVILFISTLILENIIPLQQTTTTTTTTTKEKRHFLLSSHHFTHGVGPILLASFLSGLNGAITQKSLQQGKILHGNGSTSTSTGSTGRNSYLFSMELCVASILILLTSLLVSEDGKQIIQNGFFYQWTGTTFIPIVTNALGGILVGLVTKHAGSVQKGFALIFGILISGIVQQQQVSYLHHHHHHHDHDNLSKDNYTTAVLTFNQIVSGILAAISLWMHAAYPYSKSIRKNESSTSSSTTITTTILNSRINQGQEQHHQYLFLRTPSTFILPLFKDTTTTSSSSTSSTTTTPRSIHRRSRKED